MQRSPGEGCATSRSSGSCLCIVRRQPAGGWRSWVRSGQAHPDVSARRSRRSIRFGADSQAMPSPEPQPRQSQVSLTTVFTVCFGVVSVVALVLFLWQKLQHSPWFVRLDARLHVQEQLRESGPAAVGAVNPLLSAIGGVVTGLAGLLAFLFLAIFMLVFGRDLVMALFAELNPASRERTERIAAKIYRSVGGYLGGLLGICAINAILTTVFLVIVRMPFFLPLGILSGTSSLVPYAGPLVVGAAITLFALISGGVWTALAAAIYFVIYGQLEGNVLAPFIYRRTAHVNPLVTLLAILFLVEFMGILGAVAAVPVAAAAQIVIAEIVAIRLEQARHRETA